MFCFSYVYADIKITATQFEAILEFIQETSTFLIHVSHPTKDEMNRRAFHV